MKNRKNPSKGDFEMNKMVRSLDKLARLEALDSEYSPVLQKDLVSGKSPEELLEKWKAAVTAKLIQNALFEEDTGKSTAAAKDILDRTMGKPVEKKTVEHRLGKLPDAELKALVQSKLKKK